MYIAYTVILWTGALIVVQEVAAVGSILARLRETMISDVNIFTVTTKVVLLTQTFIVIEVILWHNYNYFRVYRFSNQGVN